MRTSTLRTVCLLSLVALVVVAAMTLHVSARTQDNLQELSGTPRPAKVETPGGPFVACPVPSCMAPCQFGVPPQGLCKAPNGRVSATTYTCCCCGGSNGYSFASF